MRTRVRVLKLANLFLALQMLFVSTPALAQNYFKATEEKTRFSLKGNEFLSGHDYGDTLMRVNLLGAVAKPGTHMVPAQTSFSSLLSFAGGPTADADMENITVKRKVQNKYEVIDYNLEEFLSEPEMKDLALKPNDIIHVPQKKRFLSDSSLRALTVASTILGIIVSGIVINDRL